jgi:hypothetical protein
VQTLPFNEIANVYSTPGYINVLRHDGGRVEIPKVFARGALLLALLREHRPAASMTEIEKPGTDR